MHPKSGTLAIAGCWFGHFEYIFTNIKYKLYKPANWYGLTLRKLGVWLEKTDRLI